MLKFTHTFVNVVKLLMGVQVPDHLSEILTQEKTWQLITILIIYSNLNQIIKTKMYLLIVDFLNRKFNSGKFHHLLNEWTSSTEGAACMVASAEQWDVTSDNRAIATSILRRPNCENNTFSSQLAISWYFCSILLLTVGPLSSFLHTQ